MKTILFLCGHNAGRSQMAQAIFNHFNDNKDFAGESAGTNIASEVNPVCVEALKEIDIDMSDSSVYYPKKVDFDRKYFRVYSMGCNVKCDIEADEDLGLDDPAGQGIDAVRPIRDQIVEKIKKIISDLPTN